MILNYPSLSLPVLSQGHILGGKPLPSAGAEIKVSKLMEDKNPMVLGRLGRNPDVPTVTFYGHYDVQPAMEREWATDPFEIAAIDGYLYGRGTSDNKVTHHSLPFHSHCRSPARYAPN